MAEIAPEPETEPESEFQFPMAAEPEKISPIEAEFPSEFPTEQEFTDTDAIEEEFPSEEATFSEAAQGFARGGIRSIVEGGSPIAGMLMGAKIGALGGPAAPVTVPAGAFVGFVSGYFGGKEAVRQASKFSITRPFEEEPENVRPYVVAGEVSTISLGAARGVMALANKGFQWGDHVLGRFGNKILSFAKEHPGTFFKAEVAAASGAATAEGISEAYAPGEMGKRFIAGALGGYFNPPRMIIGATHKGIGSVRRSMSFFSQEARETRAGQQLIKMFEEAGDDPDAMIRLLNEVDIDLGKDAIRTPAQRIDSPTLRTLEAELSKRSAKFGAEVEERAMSALRAMETMMTMLMRTGKPEAFMEVAKLRKSYFESILETRVLRAEEIATEAARKILKTGDSPKNISRISVSNAEAAGAALEQSRAIERELWGNIDLKVVLNATQTKSTISAYLNNLVKKLPKDKLDPAVEDMLLRMRVAVQQAADPEVKQTVFITAQDLQNLRSKSLEMAGEMAEAGRRNFARIYGELAEGALGDMDRALNGMVGYDIARAFTSALSDVWIRSFAGTTRQIATRGQPPIPAEVLLRTAVTGPNEAVALRFKELEDAVSFLPRLNRKGGFKIKGMRKLTKAERADAVEMQDAHHETAERYLRVIASEAIDETGRASPKKLRAMMNKYPELLESFPNIKKELDLVLKAEGGVERLARAAQGFSKGMDENVAFSKMVGYDSGEQAIEAAIKSATPIQTLLQMGRVAQQGGKASAGGFRTAIWDYAVRDARTLEVNPNTLTPAVNLLKVGTNLFGELRPGQPSLIQIMQDSGSITPNEVKGLENLFKQVTTIVKSQAANRGLDDPLVDVASGLESLGHAILGARTGAQLGTGVTGSSLLLAGKGSAFVQNVMSKIPGSKVMEVMFQAGLDSRFMAMLMQKPRTIEEGLAGAQQLHAYLLAAGLTSFDFDPFADEAQPLGP
jgi:hypothetical protein